MYRRDLGGRWTSAIQSDRGSLTRRGGDVKMLLLRAVIAAGFLAPLAHADTLRLRDGTVMVGTYVGGTQTEIWFQRNPSGAEAFPLYVVESVRFGNLIGSSAP